MLGATDLASTLSSQIQRSTRPLPRRPAAGFFALRLPHPLTKRLEPRPPLSMSSLHSRPYPRCSLGRRGGKLRPLQKNGMEIRYTSQIGHVGLNPGKDFRSARWLAFEAATSGVRTKIDVRNHRRRCRFLEAGHGNQQRGLCRLSIRTGLPRLSSSCGKVASCSTLTSEGPLSLRTVPKVRSLLC
jgi:hypothetical protein